MFYFKAVTVKLLPFDNKSEVQLVADLPEGTSLEATGRVLEQAGFEVERSTYANITFFLPILLVRKLMQLIGIRTDTENTINVPALNGVFGAILGAESTILRYMNLPFGVSGLCVARVKVQK